MTSSCEFPKCKDGCLGHTVQAAVPRGSIIISKWGASMLQQEQPLRPLRRASVNYLPTIKEQLASYDVEVTI